MSSLREKLRFMAIAFLLAIAAQPLAACAAGIAGNDDSGRLFVQTYREIPADLVAGTTETHFLPSDPAEDWQPVIKEKASIRVRGAYEDPEKASIPEPGTMALLGTALIAIAVASRLKTPGWTPFPLARSANWSAGWEDAAVCVARPLASLGIVSHRN